MSADTNTESPAAGLPEAAVERKRRFSLIWLIPIVAAIAGAFLIYKTFAERGPLVTIVFEAASGIEPGKTPVKYRDVQLGVVEKVTLSEDFKQVIVNARMDKSAEDQLREGTQFWIESARITAAGVSGLGTLLSGAYIVMRPGEGKPTHNFTALDTPPVYQVDLPGKRYVLRADRLGSVSAGAPIYFRGIQVGSILGHKLDDDGNHVSIFAFVRAPYDAFVRDSTHFWNASGIDVSLTAAGVNVQTESLQSVLIGGVAFDSPFGTGASQAAADGKEFPLFASLDAIQTAQYTTKVPFRLYFDGSVSGLERGSPVTYNGLKLGEVTDLHLVTDPQRRTARIPVTIAIEPQRWTVVGEQEVTPEITQQRVARWIDGGLRAQLQSGNLLTGQQIIALQLIPDAPKATVAYEDGVLIIPTVPSQVEQLTEKVTAFLDKLDKSGLLTELYR